MDRELVISPYSTFLALSADPPRAIRNLKLLQKLGLEGKYGMFESADFTPARQVDKSRYTVVKCYMAHHLGMSLLSLDNLLCGKSMQKRFMSDVRMDAFLSCLKKKFP